MKKYLQLAIQAIFLIFFLFLIAHGRVQMWMGLFVVSVLTIFLLGRVYCGWICPINTLMKSVAWIKKKFRIKSARIPAGMTKPWIRIFALALFVAVFVFIMVSGKKLPVLPVLFVMGIMLTFFFPEELWHRYLCPYGAIMSVPARRSKYAMTTTSELCNSCGMCLRVCPAKAIEKCEGHYEILKKDCLVCMECAKICNQKAINYK